MLHLQHFLQSGLVRPCWMCQRPCGETGVKVLQFLPFEPNERLLPDLSFNETLATKQNSPLVGPRKILQDINGRNAGEEYAFHLRTLAKYFPSFSLLCSQGEYCCLQLKPDKTGNTIAARRLENTHTAAQQNSIRGGVCESLWTCWEYGSSVHCTL